MDQIPPTSTGTDDTNAMPAARRTGTVRPIHIVAVALLLVAFIFSLGIVRFDGAVATDDAQVEGHLAPVSPKVAGNVLRVLIDDNYQVKEGDLLVEIDPRDYQARLDQARAALQVAISQADAARLNVPYTQQTTTSGTSGASAQVDQDTAELDRSQVAYEQASGADLLYAQANVTSRQATYDRAASDLERARPLVAKLEISQQQFDVLNESARVAHGELVAAQERLRAAQKQADVAQRAVASAQSRLAKSKASMREFKAKERQSDIEAASYESAKANVQQAKANLEQAELNLSYTKVTAPIEGVVTRKSVEPGQVLAPGQSLLTLVPLDKIWVVANFKETQLAHVTKGQKAKLRVDMYRGREFDGTVDSIAGATGSKQSLLPPENATGNFVKVVQRIPVKIWVTPSESARAVLRPGMNVEARIYIN